MTGGNSRQLMEPASGLKIWLGCREMLNLSGSEGHLETVFKVRSSLGAWCPSGGGAVDAEDLDMVGIVDEMMRAMRILVWLQAYGILLAVIFCTC